MPVRGAQVRCTSEDRPVRFSPADPQGLKPDRSGRQCVALVQVDRCNAKVKARSRALTLHQHPGIRPDALLGHHFGRLRQIHPAEAPPLNTWKR